MKATLNRSKRLLGIEQAPPRHWVGDGFPVHSMFSYDSAPSLSPFLLLRKHLAACSGGLLKGVARQECAEEVEFFGLF